MFIRCYIIVLLHHGLAALWINQFSIKVLKLYITWVQYFDLKVTRNLHFRVLVRVFSMNFFEDEGLLQEHFYKSIRIKTVIVNDKRLENDHGWWHTHRHTPTHTHIHTCELSMQLTYSTKVTTFKRQIQKVTVIKEPSLF